MSTSAVSLSDRRGSGSGSTVILSVHVAPDPWDRMLGMLVKARTSRGPYGKSLGSPTRTRAETQLVSLLAGAHSTARAQRRRAATATATARAALTGSRKTVPLCRGCVVANSSPTTPLAWGLFISVRACVCIHAWRRGHYQRGQVRECPSSQGSMQAP